MPSNPQTIAQYHLSNIAYRAVLISAIAIPATLMWLAAFYGYEQVRKYVNTVKNSKEGEGFERLAMGVKWAAFLLPSISLLLLLLRAISNSSASFLPAAIIIGNYATLIGSLIAFSIIGRGARLLADRVKVRPSLSSTRIGMLIFLSLVTFYSYFVLSHALRGPSPYHLSTGLLLTTVMIPYVYAWFVGLLAALDIRAVGRHTPGILYQRGLHRLAMGLFIVITSTILLQCLNSIHAGHDNLVFGGVLLTRYLLYASVAAGFVLLGNGAKQLSQIEKV
ncbi:hypothetical protein KC963_05630 [Candidatus Saccharibacteria bacterium]|nr:hypothetical protein [Candidatus Saccharibacteria bacterium]